MPTNALSAASCTIKLLDPTSTTSTTCPEYLHRSLTDPRTGAHQEIVTIESKESHRFEVSYDVHPTASDLLAKKSNNQARSSTTCQSLRLHDYAVEIFMDGVGIGTFCCSRSRKLGPRSISEIVENETTVRAFQFAPLQLVDPDDHLDEDHQQAESRSSTRQICQDENVIKSLGRIDVRFYKCRLIVRERKKNRASMKGSGTWTKTTNEMSFSEAIKNVGLSSTAGLSQPSIIEPSAKGGKYYWIKSQEANPFLHIKIESDSESEKERGTKVKKTETAKQRAAVKKEEDAGCGCACKKKRAPGSDLHGAADQSAHQKRSRPADAEDQKPKIEDSK